MRDRRVLVTGARGLIGRTVIARLAARWPAAPVVATDLADAQELCDLTDRSAVHALVALADPDVVFHCAGSVQAADEAAFSARLEAPTRVLAEALAAEAPGATLVVPGSAAEYGSLPEGRAAFTEGDPPRPESAYGRAKLAQTRLVLEAAARHGVDARVGRLFNLIGPGIPAAFLIGRVAAQLAAIRAGTQAPRLELGGLDAVRDFVDLRDACDGLLAIAECGESGGLYNVCSGTGRRAREAVEAMVRASGLAVEIGEDAAGSPRGALDASVGDPRRIAAACGWRAGTPFETSARDAVAMPAPAAGAPRT